MKHENDEHSERKVFLSGFCKEDYSFQDLKKMLKEAIPGFQKLILPQKIYKGYGFIKLKDEKTALELLNTGKVLVGETWLTISPYKDRGTPNSNKVSLLDRKIFVHNIPHWIKEHEFRQLFEEHGEVQEAYICQRNKNKGYRKSSSKMIGYVVFKSEDAAKEVVKLEYLIKKGNKFYVCHVKNRKNHKNLKNGKTEKNSKNEKKGKSVENSKNEVSGKKSKNEKNSDLEKNQSGGEGKKESHDLASAGSKGGVSKIEKFREMIRFHGSKPWSKEYTELSKKFRKGKFGVMSERRNFRFNKF